MPEKHLCGADDFTPVNYARIVPEFFPVPTVFLLNHACLAIHALIPRHSVCPRLRPATPAQFHEAPVKRQWRHHFGEYRVFGKSGRGHYS